MPVIPSEAGSPFTPKGAHTKSPPYHRTYFHCPTCGERLRVNKDGDAVKNPYRPKD